MLEAKAEIEGKQHRMAPMETYVEHLVRNQGKMHSFIFS